MQFLARLMDHVLAERGERATIVGATSGDTGGAAIEAFRGRERVDIAILFPDGRVSPVQRRQMTTARETNVQAIAIEGTFDDAQALVKGMFNDFRFRDRVRLSGVNSINWGRIVAQIVYYFTAAVALGAPHRPVSFTVPTGNFGNIFAGYAAKRMGLPIERLVVATNVERHPAPHAVRAAATRCAASAPPPRPPWTSRSRRTSSGCCSRSTERDAGAVRRLMAGLDQSGAFTLERRRTRSIWPRSSPPARPTRRRPRPRSRARCSGTGIVVDPHTAVGVAVAERHLGATPMVTLATAHPAKFPDAVEAACGVRPELPDWAKPILTREERYDVLPAELGAVERAIEARTRAARRWAEHERRGHPPRERRHRRHACHAASGKRRARALGRRRRALGNAERARHLASPRAHGLQGHDAAERARHRRGDRGGRRRDERRDERRPHDLLRAPPEGGPGARARRARRHRHRSAARPRRA